MKINQLTKLALLLFSLSGMVACSSTSEEVDSGPAESVAEVESGIDATTRRTQELEAEAGNNRESGEEP